MRKIVLLFRIQGGIGFEDRPIVISKRFEPVIGGLVTKHEIPPFGMDFRFYPKKFSEALSCSPESG